MQSSTIVCNNSSIHFLHGGFGVKPLICFHGYGEHAGYFEFLEKELRQEYRIIAIDIPFHGATQWTRRDINCDELEEIITTILSSLSIHKKVPLTLLGFSLGARLALALTERKTLPVDKLVLLAPDGLTVNNWYWLATQTMPGKKLFAYIMRRPAVFTKAVRLLNKAGMVNTSILKFVNHYIRNEEVRKQLYERWIGLRKIKPSLGDIKTRIMDEQVLVRIVYGRHDRIIRSGPGERFVKGIEPYAAIIMLDAGHQVLHERHKAEICMTIRE